MAAEELNDRFLAPAREEGFFMERRYAETHPEFKQPIPYVALFREAEHAHQAQGESTPAAPQPPASVKPEVLCLTRLKTQGEKRLHGRRSIGVGGHINPCDDQGSDLFAAACHRELHEELVLPHGDPQSGTTATAASPGPDSNRSDFEQRLTPIGILNDDRSEVGAVHFGLVYRFDVNGLSVSIRETSAMQGNFVSLDQLRRDLADEAAPFESWSEMLIRSDALEGTPRVAGSCRL